MPIDSLYESTKFSIEQGIMDLQQKFRRRNEYELQRQLAQSLLQQDRAYRQQKQLQRAYIDSSKYTNTILQKTSCDLYTNSLLYDSYHIDPVNLHYSQLKQAIRRQAEHLEYLKHLERLREQSLLAIDHHSQSPQKIRPNAITTIHQQQSLVNNHASPIRQLSTTIKGSLHESRNNYSSAKSPIKISPYLANTQYDQSSVEEESLALLEKYNKGIRVEEYNRDMERLFEIQKRLKRMQQQELSAAKSAYSKQAEKSLVSSYHRPQYDESKYQPVERGRQKAPIVPVKQNARYQAQKHIRIEDDEDVNLRPQIENSQCKKIEMFSNQKIGEEIKKKKEQKIQQKPQFSKTQQVGLERIDKFIKNSQAKYQMQKQIQQPRPNSSRPRTSTKRQLSKTTNSALSPLKSERALPKKQLYQPYLKTNRPQAKSLKQQKTSRSKYEPSYTKQINSRLIPLDPDTQKVYEQIIKKQINQKIENRLKLLTCVFKDSNLRKGRNQIDALVQRFQIEARGRKQIKTMINNDPKILKKHKMVVG